VTADSVIHDETFKQPTDNILNWREGIPSDFDEWYLEKCISMLTDDQNNVLAHLRLYFIYRKKGDQNNARTHLNKITNIDPNYKPAAVNYFIGETY